jgi:hypothetical protein
MMDFPDAPLRTIQYLATASSLNVVPVAVLIRSFNLDFTYNRAVAITRTLTTPSITIMQQQGFKYVSSQTLDPTIQHTAVAAIAEVNPKTVHLGILCTLATSGDR